MEYPYSTKEFGISDEGIHLLRHRFNYKTIPFSKIERVELRKGMQLNNWLVIFLIGSAMLITGIYLSAGIFDFFGKGEVQTRTVRIIYLIFIPIVGAYFIYESLQFGLILEVSFGGVKRKQFHLKKLMPASRQKFGEFMKSKIGHKFVDHLEQTRVRFS